MNDSEYPDVFFGTNFVGGIYDQDDTFGTDDIPWGEDLLADLTIPFKQHLERVRELHAQIDAEVEKRVAAERRVEELETFISGADGYGR